MITTHQAFKAIFTGINEDLFVKQLTNRVETEPQENDSEITEFVVRKINQLSDEDQAVLKHNATVLVGLSNSILQCFVIYETAKQTGLQELL